MITILGGNQAIRKCMADGLCQPSFFFNMIYHHLPYNEWRDMIAVAGMITSEAAMHITLNVITRTRHTVY